MNASINILTTKSLHTFPPCNTSKQWLDNEISFDGALPQIKRYIILWHFAAYIDLSFETCVLMVRERLLYLTTPTFPTLIYNSYIHIPLLTLRSSDLSTTYIWSLPVSDWVVCPSSCWESTITREGCNHIISNFIGNNIISNSSRFSNNGYVGHDIVAPPHKIVIILSRKIYVTPRRSEMGHHIPLSWKRFMTF